MIKRGIVALAAIVSIAFTGCSGLETQSAIKTLEPEQVAENRETETTVAISIPEEVESEENGTSLNQGEIVLSEEEATPAQEPENSFSEPTESLEETVADNDVTTVETVQVESASEETEESPVLEAFIPSENTSTFEYDAVNNMYIINGTPYEIESDGVYYHAGYMFYAIGNTEMELIAHYINGKYQERYWRDDYVPELLEMAENSTLLECFMDGGGKIENYYVLTSPEFYYTYYEADVPIVVEYSFGGEIYHTIVVIRLSYEKTAEAERYWVVDMIQLENLDNYEGEN